MNRDLRVLVLAHKRGRLQADGALAEGRPLVVHGNDPDMFSHTTNDCWGSGTQVPVDAAQYTQIGTKLP